MLERHNLDDTGISEHRLSTPHNDLFADARYWPFRMNLLLSEDWLGSDEGLYVLLS